MPFLFIHIYVFELVNCELAAAVEVSNLKSKKIHPVQLCYVKKMIYFDDFDSKIMNSPRAQPVNLCTVKEIIILREA
ncbi:hypothetical protein ACTXT7_012045 [Hymenolepis weldensis]